MTGEGTDCVKFIEGAAAQAGLGEYGRPEHNAYSGVPSSRNALRDAFIAVGCSPLSCSCNALPGDILVAAYWRKKPGWGSHVAILTDRGIIHAMTRPGVVAEQGISTIFRKRVTCALRLPTLVGVPWTGPNPWQQ